jgi:hypothetical protein
VFSKRRIVKVASGNQQLSNAQRPTQITTTPVCFQMSEDSKIGVEESHVPFQDGTPRGSVQVEAGAHEGTQEEIVGSANGHIENDLDNSGGVQNDEAISLVNAIIGKVSRVTIIEKSVSAPPEEGTQSASASPSVSAAPPEECGADSTASISERTGLEKFVAPKRECSSDTEKFVAPKRECSSDTDLNPRFPIRPCSRTELAFTDTLVGSKKILRRARSAVESQTRSGHHDAGAIFPSSSVCANANKVSNSTFFFVQSDAELMSKSEEAMSPSLSKHTLEESTTERLVTQPAFTPVKPSEGDGLHSRGPSSEMLSNANTSSENFITHAQSSFFSYVNSTHSLQDQSIPEDLEVLGDPNVVLQSSKLQPEVVQVLLPNNKSFANGSIDAGDSITELRSSVTDNSHDFTANCPMLDSPALAKATSEGGMSSNFSSPMLISRPPPSKVASVTKGGVSVPRGGASSSSQSSSSQSLVRTANQSSTIINPFSDSPVFKSRDFFSDAAATTTIHANLQKEHSLDVPASPSLGHLSISEHSVVSSPAIGIMQTNALTSYGVDGVIHGQMCRWQWRLRMRCKTRHGQHRRAVVDSMRKRTTPTLWRQAMEALAIGSWASVSKIFFANKLKIFAE